MGFGVRRGLRFGTVSSFDKKYVFLTFILNVQTMNFIFDKNRTNKMYFGSTNLQ